MGQTSGGRLATDLLHGYFEGLRNPQLATLVVARRVARASCAWFTGETPVPPSPWYPDLFRDDDLNRCRQRDLFVSLSEKGEALVARQIFVLGLENPTLCVNH